MTQTTLNKEELIDLKPLQKVNVAQQIFNAKSLDEAVKIMDKLAANGWLTLWDGATHADGSSYKDLPAWQAKATLIESKLSDAKPVSKYDAPYSGREGFLFEFKDGNRQFSWADELDHYSEPVTYKSVTKVKAMINAAPTPPESE